MAKKKAQSLLTGEEFALRLLARRDYSQEEMRKKLIQKGFPFGEVEEVLEKITTQRLINDRRYAQRLINYYGQGKFWGPYRLIQKLREKGISPELAKEVVTEEEKNFSASKRLKALLKKKLKNRALTELSAKEIKKITNYLHQHGFAWEDIVAILKEEGGLLKNDDWFRDSSEIS